MQRKYYHRQYNLYEMHQAFRRTCSISADIEYRFDILKEALQKFFATEVPENVMEKMFKD
jgi:hypothetical protein